MDRSDRPLHPTAPATKTTIDLRDPWHRYREANRAAFGSELDTNALGCGSSGGTSRGLWDDVLGVAGLVDAVTFLGEVVVPVVVEVAVAADGAEFEDGLCTG